MSSELHHMSQWSKQEKINFIAQKYFPGHNDELTYLLQSFWHSDQTVQKIFDEFSENTLTNYYMPYGVAPHFVIDGQHYMIPMVIEESSVVAAASKSAKFWKERGGFHTEVISTTKVGQVHFLWKGDSSLLFAFFNQKRQVLLDSVADLLVNMEKRGGGLTHIELRDLSDKEPDYYQLFVNFETCDAMGANFINSVLERLSQIWRSLIASNEEWAIEQREISVIMSILSNYTPDCRVKVSVRCPVKQLKGNEELSSDQYAEKFMRAVRVAQVDIYRATTHNKGIFNGIDAVVLATGNDFRAVEAAGHAFASRKGSYSGLTSAKVEDGEFFFQLEIPIALGTIGGLTRLHPLAKLSLHLLGNPSASMLMRIAASVGLAQNFAAVNSLITTGIQKGHMKMHLMNILTQLGAVEEEREKARDYFKERVISFRDVRYFIESLRSMH